MRAAETTKCRLPAVDPVLTPETIQKDAKEAEPDIVRVRRQVHRHPELSYQEAETAKLVASELGKLGIDVRAGVGGTGVVGTLKGGLPGKVVGLRADMDALPLEEKAEVDFRSETPGAMHACGHDTHVAMLLGAAAILAKNREKLNGTVRFLFQPAEENGGKGGAKPMIEDGAMKDPQVDYVFGVHITGEYPSGTFALTAGAAMAAPDTFKVRILGKGGHGSAPDKTVDPVYVAAHVVLALQGVSSRMVDPVEPFVVSVGSISAGTKENIIPDDATLLGTMRSLDEKVRAGAKEKIRGVTEGICAAFGAKGEVEFVEDAYPVTFNDLTVTPAVAETLKKLEGGAVVEVPPILGGEDFSRFLAEAPGTFYFLGTKNPAKGCVHPNHSSMFKVDEDVLKLGAASLALLASEFGAR